MNLISCDGCGVVLDAHKLYFPVELYDENGVINNQKAILKDGEYVGKVECPVCQDHVTRE